jgi:hypothetical protein
MCQLNHLSIRNQQETLCVQIYFGILEWIKGVEGSTCTCLKTRKEGNTHPQKSSTKVWFSVSLSSPSGSCAQRLPVDELGAEQKDLTLISCLLIHCLGTEYTGFHLSGKGILQYSPMH